MEKQHQSEVVIFTDLDGTLLDRITYSYDKALPSVEHLLQKAIPVILRQEQSKKYIDVNWAFSILL
jgi:mannosyl-3-phosphoglycerate phosphatase